MKLFLFRHIIPIVGVTGWVLVLTLLPDAFAKPDNLLLYSPVYHIPFLATILTLPFILFVHAQTLGLRKPSLWLLLGIYFVVIAFYLLTDLQTGGRRGVEAILFLLLLFIILGPLIFALKWLTKALPLLSYFGCAAFFAILAGYICAKVPPQ